MPAISNAENPCKFLTLFCGRNSNSVHCYLSFGQNNKPKAQLPPFLESLKDAMNERILFVLAICSILSIITGMIADPKLGWLKGVCLLIALVILVLITSLVDWIKDR